MRERKVQWMQILGPERDGSGRDQRACLKYLLLGQELATAPVVACRLWDLDMGALFGLHI